MKNVLYLAVSLFLLAGLTACGEHNAGNTSKTSNNITQSKKTETTAVSTQTSNKTSSITQNESDHHSNQVSVTLVDVVDGDTIRVNDNGKQITVRYLLIDAPEEKKPDTCVQPYAVDAANRNKQLVNSGKLTLEFEHGEEYDQYGRMLAYVYANGISVQEILLKEGYARIDDNDNPSYKHLKDYQRDESQAWNKGLRIWSQSGYVLSDGFNGCVDSGENTTTSTPTVSNNTTNPSTTTAQSTTTTEGSTTPSESTEIFANCTELRKKYPDGVPMGHPAYQDDLDRDKDGVACESK